MKKMNFILLMFILFVSAQFIFATHKINLASHYITFESYGISQSGSDVNGNMGAYAGWEGTKPGYIDMYLELHRSNNNFETYSIRDDDEAHFEE